MPHMIEEDDNIAWVSTKPWHGLGVEVGADLSAEEMMEVAGVNWEVEKYPLCAVGSEDGMISVPGKAALVRKSDNKVLDVVGDDWNICQNSEAFQFFHDFVKAGDMTMETAGSLRGGKYVWALARVKKEFTLFNSDTILPYLLFTNPHMYGTSIDVRFTAVRVVCNNTLTSALQSNGKAFKTNHSVKFNPDIAKAYVGLAASKLDNYHELAKFLASKPYTDETANEYFNKLYPVIKTEKKDGEESKRVVKSESLGVKNCKLALTKQPGAEYGAGSWWQIFNAVTYYTDHIQGHDDDRRLTNIWYGANKDKKIKALNLAKEFAEAS